MDDDNKISGKFPLHEFETNIQEVHGRVTYAPHEERTYCHKKKDLVTHRMRLYYNKHETHVGTWQKGHGWYAEKPSTECVMPA